jgi:predicted Rdx family selenoprotein
VEGGRGEFTVWVGGELVAQKDLAGGFPEENDILAAVRQALSSAD